MGTPWGQRPYLLFSAAYQSLAPLKHGWEWFSLTCTPGPGGKYSSHNPHLWRRQGNWLTLSHHKGWGAWVQIQIPCFQVRASPTTPRCPEGLEGLVGAHPFLGLCLQPALLRITAQPLENRGARSLLETYYIGSSWSGTVYLKIVSGNQFRRSVAIVDVLNRKSFASKHIALWLNWNL